MGKLKSIDESSVDDSIPEIIYIMGTGRSGTTILEVLLSNNPGICGVGEVNYIFEHCLRNNVTCSCGKPSLECMFWKRINQRCNWAKSKLQLIIDVFRSIEWHTNFPLIYLNLVPKKKMRLYSDVNRRLFHAIQSISGQMVIVDSSKYAGRALALSRIFSSRLRVLCVTRSPQGLLKAFQNKNTQEQKPKSLMGTLAYYVYVLICCRLVANRIGQNAYQIRYDDLVADPMGTLKSIENWSGLDLSEARAKISRGDLFEIGHIVTGNRLRRKWKVRFQPDLGHRPISGFCERAVFSIMNLACLILRF